MRFISILALILNTLIVSAQSEWQNYTAIDYIQEIEVYDSVAYVANAGGLLIIDLVTGSDELLMPANSTFEGFATEIEFLSNGHAWVASGGKLMYFDGQHFELYDMPDTIDFIRPKSLKIYNDELWFLDFHEDLYSIKDMVIKDHSVSFPDDIEYIDLDSEGNVWVLNKEVVYEYDGSEILSITEIYPGEEVSQMDAFYIDTEDILWMSVRPKSNGDLELAYIDDQGWNVFKTHYRVHTFFEHDSLGVCFSSKFIGFGYINEGSLGFIHFDSLFTDIPWGDSNRAQFKKWEGNNAWFTGWQLEEPVIHRYVDDELYKYGYNDVFLGEISDVEADCNNVLYKAGESFLEKFVDNHWEAIYPDYSDEECIIEHLELNPFTCELWGYGRPNGNKGCNTLWQFTENDIIETYTLDFGIIELAFAPDGKIYTITPDRGLNYIDKMGNLHPIEIDSTIYFSDLFITSEGMIWVIGTDWTNPCYITQSLFVGSGDGEWIEYHESITDVSPGSTCNIIEDDMGNLWFQGSNKLVKFDGKNWTSYPMYFSPLGLEEFIMDELGNFWIATREVGLVYWDREDFTYYNTENSDLFDNRCISLERINNYLWIEHTNGLSRMKIDGATSSNLQDYNKPEAQFTLFPNPTHGSFNVKGDPGIERRYDVYSITGEHILSETSDEEVWSSSLETGVYLVRVTIGTREFVEKLIVL